MKHGTAVLDEAPVALRALYGSASALLVLIGAHAITSAARTIGEGWSGFGAALVPDLVMGTVVAASVLVGAAVRGMSHRRRLSLCLASSRPPA